VIQTLLSVDLIGRYNIWPNGNVKNYCHFSQETGGGGGITSFQRLGLVNECLVGV